MILKDFNNSKIVNNNTHYILLDETQLFHNFKSVLNGYLIKIIQILMSHLAMLNFYLKSLLLSLGDII